MNYLKNPLYLFVVIGVLLITNIGCITYIFLKNDECPTCEKEDIIQEKNETEEDEETKEFYNVDIKGYVKKPGVYQLEKGSIINDVIKLAGGLKSSGTTENINLSKKVNDEDMIIILSKTELKKLNSSESIKQNSNITTNNETATKSEEDSNKISINNATKEELMTLSGIGEKTAEKIIEYRKNQKFSTIDDLKNVSGIGDSIFEKIKEYITI